MTTIRTKNHDELEIQCKIKIQPITSDSNQDYRKILKELCNALMVENNYSQTLYEYSYTNENSYFEKVVKNNLEYFLYPKLEALLKGSKFHFTNFKFRQGSLIITFTIIFEIINNYKNINDIIELILEDYSNYIELIMDEYNVSYKFYIPQSLNIQTNDNIIQNNDPIIKRKFKIVLLQIILPILFGLGSAKYILYKEKLVTIQEEKARIEEIINKKLYDFKIQEKLDFLYYYNNNLRQIPNNNQIRDSANLCPYNKFIENKLSSIEKSIKKINSILNYESTHNSINYINKNFKSKENKDTQKNCGINIHNNIQITNDSLRISKSNKEPEA